MRPAGLGGFLGRLGYDVKTSFERAGRRAEGRGAVRGLARLGFVARGVLYIVIGMLAVEIATGHPASQASQSGALKTIAAQTFGHLLLIVVTIGLGGYVLGRVVEAVTARGVGGKDKHFGERIAAAGSAVGYTLVLLLAVSILTGSGHSSGSIDPFVRKGMNISPVIVAVAGGITIGVALVQLYNAWKRPFLEDLAARGDARSAIAWLGSIGFGARGILFGVIGYELLAAAVSYDSKKAVGLDGALIKSASSAAGPIVMIIIALGLVAFGLFSITQARYSQI